MRNLLWIKANNRQYKLYGSTPSGRSNRYSYYVTKSKLSGKKIRIRCSLVDDQIPDWLGGITIDPELLHSVSQVYQEDVAEVTEKGRDAKLSDLRRKISRLKEEEAKIARLLILSKVSEDTYNNLRVEWHEKLCLAKNTLAEMEKETTIHLSDLDLALALMVHLPELYDRLKKNDQVTLLHILAKCIIVNPQGDIVDHELRSPFMYLRAIADNFYKSKGCGSVHVQPGPLDRTGAPNPVCDN